ncbi:endolytic transglycosylase MltG [Streptomyces cavernicola]|uniref:Endolytic murein transglycosylase n=1 Tax=Streptomyces cavernicola TaxID=3043613 RepID=A0ABT6S8A1_9ACTN|nr:endolytic transglycosylase MltG [Streptomyces sp. B-S-A6]MDI3404109.1 endolytic transglycosylase MltG [Streptomyces sp. B-S-A6]
MVNKTPRQGKIRLTRRGRVALLVTGALVIGTAVAVPLLLNRGDDRPDTLLVPEGWRAGQVYEAVDKALGVEKGTTKKVAGSSGLKLPGESGGNPEGYLFPATYPIGGKSTPKSVLAYMVDTANKKFGAGSVTAGADRNAVSVYQLVTIASIVQAEADTKKDMAKVARVVYNRLDRGMPLQMDSTLNYALNRSTLDTKNADTKLKSPYNTYEKTGLPPTPIANPGQEALEAALAPTEGDWLYFVTVKPGDTRFTVDYQQHRSNVEEFNREFNRDRQSEGAQQPKEREQAPKTNANAAG